MVTVYRIFKSYCSNLHIPYFILQSQTIRASIPEEAIPASSKPSSTKGLPPKDVIEHVACVRVYMHAHMCVCGVHVRACVRV